VDILALRETRGITDIAASRVGALAEVFGESRQLPDVEVCWGFISCLARAGQLLLQGEEEMANVLSVAGAHSKYKLEGAKPAGFLGSLWHGMIAPITFIVSLFNTKRPHIRN
jgi:hypothetical protein